MSGRLKVAVIDGGGRGAVLVHAYARSDHVREVYAVPGNDLMHINTEGKPVHTYQNVKTTSVFDIVALCREEHIDLVDVAQDNAIAVGLVDALTIAGVKAVGPTKAAGQVEWDKAWAREFGKRAGLPQPEFVICSSPQQGIDYLRSHPDAPRFIKAVFLAEGKGALPAKNTDEAIRRIDELKRFGGAGEIFSIEEWLRGDQLSGFAPGEEFSTFAVGGGERFAIAGSAQDHKRIGTFDEGDQTGGMGCVSPPLALTREISTEVRSIFQKTFAALQKQGRPYQGVLYLGGMVVERDGKLVVYVIEWNARWGDPEAQVVIPAIVNDFFEVNTAIREGTVDEDTLQTDGKTRVVVVGASRGYPGDYTSVKGKQIFGISEAAKLDGVTIYGAGVREVDGKHYASGGRLFSIVGEGTNVIEARARAYEAMSRIFVEGNNLHYRTDIGWRDVTRFHQGILYGA